MTMFGHWLQNVLINKTTFWHCVVAIYHYEIASVYFIPCSYFVYFKIQDIIG
jgi:hypothetical protein